MKWGYIHSRYQKKEFCLLFYQYHIYMRCHILLLSSNLILTTSSSLHSTAYANKKVPKFLVAEHDVKEKPAKLFWYDWPAMLAVGGISLDDNTDDSSTSSFRPLIMTAVQSDDVDDNDNEKQKKKVTWPVQPTASKVGEFKVSPAVHAGYACTWFGLSAAGLYMTWKLITRGRG